MDFLSQLVRYIALFGIWDLVDIAIVAYIAYRLIVFSRRSNAGQVVKGIVFLLLVTQLSNVLGLNLLNFLLRNIIQIGFIAVVILFQPELRRAFERADSRPTAGIISSAAVEYIMMENIDAPPCADGLISV